jgi:hypothetical protein
LYDFQVLWKCRFCKVMPIWEWYTDCICWSDIEFSKKNLFCKIFSLFCVVVENLHSDFEISCVQFCWLWLVLFKKDGETWNDLKSGVSVTLNRQTWGLTLFLTTPCYNCLRSVQGADNIRWIFWLLYAFSAD